MNGFGCESTRDGCYRSQKIGRLVRRVVEQLERGESSGCSANFPKPAPERTCGLRRYPPCASDPALTLSVLSRRPRSARRPTSTCAQAYTVGRCEPNLNPPKGPLTLFCQIAFLFLLLSRGKKWTSHINMICTARKAVFQQLRRPLTTSSVYLSSAAFQRLASTLAILEQREGKLNHGSLSAITAAKKIGGSIHGFVAGSSIKPVADEAATADGVEKIISVANGAYDKVPLRLFSLCPRSLDPPSIEPNTNA